MTDLNYKYYFVYTMYYTIMRAGASIPSPSPLPPPPLPQVLLNGVYVTMNIPYPFQVRCIDQRPNLGENEQYAIIIINRGQGQFQNIVLTRNQYNNFLGVINTGRTYNNGFWYAVNNEVVRRIIGGKRHKRSGKKRSGKKRKSHKRGHKKSRRH